MRARAIWEIAKWTVFVLPEKSLFRGHVCHKKGEEGEKKNPIPKCRLILSALMTQFRNYTFSHCGGKISGFRS